MVLSVLEFIVRYLYTGLFCLFFLVSVHAEARGFREVPLGFDKGESTLTITGRLVGDEFVDYQLRAGAGQLMIVDLQTSHLSAYFNVLPPGSEDVAIYIGSTSGNHFEAQLPFAGLYTIRLYLMRSAVRRNEVADYSLRIALSDDPRRFSSKHGAPVAEAGSLEWQLELQDIQFHVTSTDRGSLNTLTIVPSGLEIDNAPIIREIDGSVRGVELADLNADGSPEIYIYVISAGSGSYGSLVAYSSNRRKSLSDIYLPPVTQFEGASQGYMGHDEFAVVENRLVRRFPVYQDGDSNARPTGGMRQLQYRLVAGEASWILELYRVVEY